MGLHKSLRLAKTFSVIMEAPAHNAFFSLSFFPSVSLSLSAKDITTFALLAPKENN